MTSIAMDINVATLVDQHERQVDRRTGFTAWVGGRLAGLSAQAAALAGALVLRVQARWMRDQAVWFQGAAARVDASPREQVIDPEWKLIARLATLEARLERLQRLFAARGKPGGPVPALQVQSALSELTCAIADLRGALQAHEADHCAIKLRRVPAGQPAQSPEELQAAVHRLAA